MLRVVIIYYVSIERSVVMTKSFRIGKVPFTYNFIDRRFICFVHTDVLARTGTWFENKRVEFESYAKLSM